MFREWVVAKTGLIASLIYTAAAVFITSKATVLIPLEPSLTLGIAGACGFIGAMIYHSLYYVSPSSPTSSGLLSAELIPLKSDKLTTGQEYTMIANMGGYLSVIVTLTKPLPYHIVILGRQSRSQAFPLETMAPVHLEGDFPSYFKIFCTPGQETAVLELLDPADMAYIVDFCQAYDIEINRSMMTVAQPAGARQEGDKTGIVEDVTELLRRNRRIIS